MVLTYEDVDKVAVCYPLHQLSGSLDDGKSLQVMPAFLSNNNRKNGEKGKEEKRDNKVLVDNIFRLTHQHRK